MKTSESRLSARCSAPCWEPPADTSQLSWQTDTTFAELIERSVVPVHVPKEYYSSKFPLIPRSFVQIPFITTFQRASFRPRLRGFLGADEGLTEEVLEGWGPSLEGGGGGGGHCVSGLLVLHQD